MVDAHIHGIAVKRAPNAVGRGAINVRQAVAKEMMRVRNGGVVEVTANNERLAFAAQSFHKVDYRICLPGALYRRIGQFGKDL